MISTRSSFYGRLVPGSRRLPSTPFHPGTRLHVGAENQLGLGALADIMAPYDVWRHFYVAGGTHTVFFTPQVAQNGVSVRTFITQMVTDDPAWATVQP
jgi:hypothetical protein